MLGQTFVIITNLRECSLRWETADRMRARLRCVHCQADGVFYPRRPHMHQKLLALRKRVHQALDESLPSRERHSHTFASRSGSIDPVYAAGHEPRHEPLCYAGRELTLAGERGDNSRINTTQRSVVHRLLSVEHGLS